MDEPTDDASAWVPVGAGLTGLRRAAQECRGCELWREASRAVFGEGPRDARLMLVGEQPGDREDTEGRPFVGPAGHLLDRALTEVGLERAEVYVTNAVKHFRWEQRGKKRIHRKPDLAHVRACDPWLREELRVVAPRVVLLLGATAGQAVLGSGFRVTRDRGRFLDAPIDALVTATVHPSSILRIRGSQERSDAFEGFVADLRSAATAASED